MTDQLLTADTVIHAWRVQADHTLPSWQDAPPYDFTWTSDRWPDPEAEAKKLLRSDGGFRRGMKNVRLSHKTITHSPWTFEPLPDAE